MPEPGRIPRRTVLAALSLAAGGGVGALAWLLSPGPRTRRRVRRIDRDLIPLLDDLAARGALSLGRVRLAERPSESDPDLLAAQLSAGRGRRQPLREHLASLIDAEAAATRLEIVDGWYLTTTEARMCALAALLAPDAAG